MIKLDLEDGKYTLIRHDDGRMEALRYGKAWRDLTGDKLIYAMADVIDAHCSINKCLNKNYEPNTRIKCPACQGMQYITRVSGNETCWRCSGIGTIFID